MFGQVFPLIFDHKCITDIHYLALCNVTAKCLPFIGALTSLKMPLNSHLISSPGSNSQQWPTLLKNFWVTLIYLRNVLIQRTFWKCGEMVLKSISLWAKVQLPFAILFCLANENDKWHSKVKCICFCFPVISSYAECLFWIAPPGFWWSLYFKELIQFLVLAVWILDALRRKAYYAYCCELNIIVTSEVFTFILLSWYYLFCNLLYA